MMAEWFLYVFLCMTAIGSARGASRVEVVSVYTGHSVTLKCNVDSVNTGIVWWKNTSSLYVALKSTDGSVKVNGIFKAHVSFKGNDLVLRELNVSNSGFYYCEAKDSIGNNVAKTVTHLIVKKVPMFQLHATYGQTVELKCVTPMKDFQSIVTWYRNDSRDTPVARSWGGSFMFRSEYQGRSVMKENNLIIKNVTMNDDALYYCVLKGDDKPVFANFVKLTVKELNVHLVTTIEGATVTLPCHTDIQDISSIEWFKNDSVTRLAAKVKTVNDLYVEDVDVKYMNRVNFAVKSNNLVFQSLVVTDSGFYFCKITKNIDGRAVVYEGSTIVEMFVLASPTCGERKREKTALNGTSVLLPCVVTGNPKPSVHWIKKSTGTLPNSKRFIETPKGLSINQVKVEDAGDYQVTLKSKSGSFTWLVKLVVNTPNSGDSFFVSGTEGNQAIIPCGDINMTESSGSARWDRKGQDVRALDDAKRFEVMKNGSLLIRSANISDIGGFVCHLVIKAGGHDWSRSINVYFNVLYRPIIFNIEAKKKVFHGRNAVLPCSSIGYPGVTHQWLNDKGEPIRKNDKYMVSTNGSLIIYNTDLGDTKKYTCAPFNKLGPGKSKSTELLVLYPPNFLKINTKLELQVNEGGNVTFDCSTSGSPTPNITWMKNNEPITTSSRINKISSNTVRLLKITNVVGSDTGIYTCKVFSIAGDATRSFKLAVKGKPGTPTSLQVTLQQSELVYMNWKRSYDGGSNQSFEIWVRTDKASEYNGWKTKMATNTENREGKTNSDSFEFTITDLIPERKVSYLFSIRAKNAQGYSGFSQLVKLIPSYDLNNNIVKGSTVDKYINNKPLAPYNVKLNITKSGYFLKWSVMNVPGRPTAKSVLIQYRELNSEKTWRNYFIPTMSRSVRKRRSVNANSGLMIKQEELDSDKPMEFQVLSVADDGSQSDPPEVKRTIFGFPRMGDPHPKEDPIVPIVLGAIFGVFILVLMLSLYCFCKKRKQNRYEASKKDRISYTRENGGSMNSPRDDDDVIDETDNVKLLSSDEFDSPKHYHLRTCPALKLGQYSTNGSVTNGENRDQVYILLQQYKEEKEMCTCNKRFMTLDSRTQKTKREKKKGLYKSNSSPSLLLGSDVEEPIDPNELLDEEGYDLSDSERDEVGELTSEKYQSLKRQNFKDSMDQFCRDGSTSKDSRTRLSSEEKTEADKSLEHHQHEDGGDLHEVSSENSATESEQIISPKEKLAADKRRSFDGKSSGYGEGSNSTSDSESISELKKPPSIRNNAFPHGYMSDTGTKRDHGYASDISTRSSPLDYAGRPRYQPPSQRHPARMNGYDPVQRHYYSEDESVRSGRSSAGSRPIQPPSYNQAIHDIERLSEKNDITDSEELYDHLMDMGRQLGVSLDDSIECDLDTKTMLNGPPRSYSNPRAFPPPLAVESGYITDSSIGTKDRYTDREKSERCAQLLNEFKSTRNNTASNDDIIDSKYDMDGEETPVEPPTIRSRSVMGDIIGGSGGFEEPRVPPVLKRSNSAGASGVYKEWLV